MLLQLLLPIVLQATLCAAAVGDTCTSAGQCGTAPSHGSWICTSSHCAISCNSPIYQLSSDGTSCVGTLTNGDSCSDDSQCLPDTNGSVTCNDDDECELACNSGYQLSSDELTCVGAGTATGTRSIHWTTSVVTTSTTSSVSSFKTTSSSATTPRTTIATTQATGTTSATTVATQATGTTRATTQATGTTSVTTVATTQATGTTRATTVATTQATSTIIATTQATSVIIATTQAIDTTSETGTSQAPTTTTTVSILYTSSSSLQTATLQALGTTGTAVVPTSSAFTFTGTTKTIVPVAAPTQLANLAKQGPPSTPPPPAVSDPAVKKSAVTAATSVLSSIFSAISSTGGSSTGGSGSGASFNFDAAAFEATLVQAALTTTGNQTAFNAGILPTPPAEDGGADGGGGNMVIVTISASGYTFENSTDFSAYGDLSGEDIPSSITPTGGLSFSFILPAFDTSVWYIFDTSADGELVVDIFTSTTALGSITFPYVEGTLQRRAAGLVLSVTQGFIPVPKSVVQQFVSAAPTPTSTSGSTTTSETSTTYDPLASLAAAGYGSQTPAPKLKDAAKKKAAYNQAALLVTSIVGSFDETTFEASLVASSVSLSSTQQPFNAGINPAPSGKSNMVVVILEAIGYKFTFADQSTQGELSTEYIQTKDGNNITLAFALQNTDNDLWYVFDTSKDYILQVDIFTGSKGLGSVLFTYSKSTLRKRSGVQAPAAIKFTQGNVAIPASAVTKFTSAVAAAPKTSTYKSKATKAYYVNCFGLARDREFSDLKFAAFWEAYNSPHGLAALSKLYEGSTNPQISEFEFMLFKKYVSKLKWCLEHHPEYNYENMASWSESGWSGYGYEAAVAPQVNYGYQSPPSTVNYGYQAPAPTQHYGYDAPKTRDADSPYDTGYYPIAVDPDHKHKGYGYNPTKEATDGSAGYNQPAPVAHAYGQASAAPAIAYGEPAPAPTAYAYGQPSPAPVAYAYGQPSPAHAAYAYGQPSPAPASYAYGQPSPAPYKFNAYANYNGPSAAGYPAQPAAPTGYYKSSQAPAWNYNPVPTSTAAPVWNYNPAPTTTAAPVWNYNPAPTTTAAPVWNYNPAPTYTAAPVWNYNPAPTSTAAPVWNYNHAPTSSAAPAWNYNQPAPVYQQPAYNGYQQPQPAKGYDGSAQSNSNSYGGYGSQNSGNGYVKAKSPSDPKKWAQSGQGNYAPVYQAPSPSPAYGYHASAYGYQAPAPAPAYVHQDPAPAPAYGYQAPAPAPAYVHKDPAPAPAYGYQAPAPAPAYVHKDPAPAPAYGYQAPAPAPTYGYQAAPAPAPGYGEETHYGHKQMEYVHKDLSDLGYVATPAPAHGYDPVPTQAYGYPPAPVHAGYNSYQAAPAARPAYGYQKAMTTTQAPAYGYQEAVTTTQAPAYGYQKAMTTTQAPAYGYQKPVPLTQAPAYGYQPAPTTVAPVAYGYNAPAPAVAPAGYGYSGEHHEQHKGGVYDSGYYPIGNDPWHEKSKGYGAKQAPAADGSAGYNAPAPAYNYGQQAAPGNNYGQQAAPANNYGQQAAPANNYGQQAAPANNYGQQATPTYNYGQQAPVNNYGGSSPAGSGYGSDNSKWAKGGKKAAKRAVR